ncbi:hypothetical protein [Modestobacter versicolor]|uniref:Uncharacterized protein n=1 Tax=Modestobacter versicolor TaxID=429133 RepID=A0A323V7U3_9ACTN|nr:hypothetical protein [Modestobacter versicolor]MBB3676495.1 hypothetical protein [Modestobacter versicolor]PZA19386.1 hypothetical protein DMO24_20995 [Modestobacter versicolor]
MSEALFGAPAGLLQRLHRSEVRVPDLRAAVDRLDPAGLGPDVELSVLDGVRGPMLVLDDTGRRTRVLLGELAVEMTRARVAATSDGVGTALTAWLARRPVPDRVAAASGIAVLDWTDTRQATLGWRVVVVRDALVVPWRPSRTATLPSVHQTRSAALGRAAVVEGELQVEGPVGLWTSTDAAGIDSAVLVRPEALLAQLARRGLPLRDAHLVVTPHRPVACAEAPVARRLVAEATDACATLPWRAVADLGWA